MITVELTPAETFLGATAGVMRCVENRSKGIGNAHGATNAQCWQMDIEGALAEMALSKFLGTYWKGKGHIKDDDVDGMEVRYTDRDNGCLIIRPDDPNRIYWLVTGVRGTYHVHGWLHAEIAKQDKYRRAPNGRPPAYFIPQSDLVNPLVSPTTQQIGA